MRQLTFGVCAWRSVWRGMLDCILGEQLRPSEVEKFPEAVYGITTSKMNYGQMWFQYTLLGHTDVC